MTEAKMQESVKYQPGTFCWVELGTTNGEAAKKFYTQLFGRSIRCSNKTAKMWGHCMKCRRI
jgi:predicted enzyme related to lactoylglutathione lyase